MKPSEGNYPHGELTHQVIGAFYKVYNFFGYGYLESGYRRALCVELRRRDLIVEKEASFEMVYEGVVVAQYRADVIVEKTVVVETKAGLNLDPAVMVQLLNYLRLTKCELGLVLHFGPRPSIKRLISSRLKLDDITPR